MGFGAAQRTEINSDQMMSIRNLVETQPSLQAARNVLHNQIFSNGLALVREGEAIQMQPSFARHIDKYWMPYARSVLDSILQFGLCVTAYDDVQDIVQMDREQTDIKEEIQHDGPGSKKRKWADKTKSVVGACTIPIVPLLGTYQLFFQPCG